MLFSFSELAGNEVDYLPGNAIWCTRNNDTSVVVGLFGDDRLDRCGCENDCGWKGGASATKPGKNACSPLESDQVRMMPRGIQ